ncbi:hypothetical protein GTI00_27255 [Klebsiella pneumoniae]|nr:hypothetical protein [Klebsiella pneumoniae]
MNRVKDAAAGKDVLVGIAQRSAQPEVVERDVIGGALVARTDTATGLALSPERAAIGIADHVVAVAAPILD